MQPEHESLFLLVRNPDPPRSRVREFANRTCGRVIGAATYALASAICFFAEIPPTTKHPRNPEAAQKPVTIPTLPKTFALQELASLPYWNRSGVWPSPASLAIERLPAPIHETTRPHGKAHPQPPLA